MDFTQIGERLDIDRLKRELAQFADDRDWNKFHSPKNLAMALAGEAGELLELFQWASEEESRDIGGARLHRTQEELADILIYLVRLADVLKIDLEAAVVAKIAENAKKYPVDLAKGNAIKYSERGANAPCPDR